MLLGPAPELVLGHREGADSLVSAGASPRGRNWGRGGGVRDPPIAILAGKTETWGSGMASPGWPCVVWAEDAPGAPKSQFGSWLCCGGSARVVPCARRGSSASGTGPVAMLRAGWHQSKGKQQPGGLGGGSCSVPSRPQGSPWLPALLSLWRLAAAEHSLVLPHGPWPQIRRGAGLATTPRGSRLPRSQGAAPGVPAALEGGKLAVWPGLVATRIQHYNAWLRDWHSPSGAGGAAGTQPPPRGSQIRLPSWGQTGAEPHQGDGAGSGRGTWGHSSTVSNRDGALSGSPCPGPGTWQGAGLCRWQQCATSHGSVAGGEPRPCCPLWQGEEMAAATSRHGPGIHGESAGAAVPRPAGATWP